MIPLVDTHCHLLAGLDDGPATQEVALRMCWQAYSEGVRMVAATAHQNDCYPDNSPQRIRSACQLLADALHRDRLPLTVTPSAEIVVRPDLLDVWKQGKLLTVADRKRHLLLELPHGLYVEIGYLVRQLRDVGLQVILAHPERHETLLHTSGLIEELIAQGCLIQVSAGSVTRPRGKADQRALKSWAKRGVIHLIGSDGHDPEARPPRLAAAYHQLASWASTAYADRVCSANGMAVLQGLMVRASPPKPQRSWFAWWQAS